MSTSRPTSSNAGTAPPRSTDVRRRTVLPSTLQNMRQTLASSSSAAGGSELPSEEYLDKMEEELNRKVDVETEVLVEGMNELVRMTKLDNKDHYRLAHESFQAECRTESMIRATHSLLSLSHTLKLLHLFSDTTTPISARERVTKELQLAIDAAMTRVDVAVGASTA